ncbi:two-component regulator propeller domain-containing protein [Zobellia alginiliquefaciens]|uniref:two-component regulator propeller domain-containing protein n=1 Tax=Zobellia alginiliquefaciens TaxID=3032586 RepID=UPI0023E45BEA|nr:two-component regulator propeller domain-containing protein [Zobellia alginiliquefaciens]
MGQVSNKIKSIYFFSLLCLGVLTHSLGQNQISFQHISTKDGLSQSDVNIIYQDKQGFMWFGTHDGINKYDGYEFTVYNLDDNDPESISSNLIFDIAADNDGNLWIGTTGSGLNFFNVTTGKFTQYTHDKNNPKSISSNHITKVFIDSKQRLWVGSRNGLDKLDLNTASEKLDSEKLEFEHFNSDINSHIARYDGTFVSSIYENKKGGLFVGGKSGIYKLRKDGKGKDFFANITDEIGLPSTTIKGIAEDATGRLFIATSRGLYYQSHGLENNFKRFHTGTFSSILLDKDNHIWAGSDRGLFYFENFTHDKQPVFLKKFIYDSKDPTSLSKNIVRSLFMDDTGIIWIGTNGGGINTFDPKRKQFQHVRNTSDPKSLSYDKIRSMFEDSNGTLWIGTEGGGLNMLKKEEANGTYKNFKHFNSISKIFAIEETVIGDSPILMIGTEGFPGLYFMDISDPHKISKEALTKTNLNNGVFSLLSDSNENMWIGTYNSGIHRWIKTDTVGHFQRQAFGYYPGKSNSISSNIIRNILEDSKGNMWFATGDGLGMLSNKERYKKRPKFKVYKHDPDDPTSISHNYILSLYESTAGTLWVGTFGGGLNKFIPGTDESQATFELYSTLDGLPNNVIKGILEDGKKNLWLSTNKGLSCFDTEKKTFQNYNPSDGLQDNEFQELACLKRADGEMLFGGINGFNAFYPDEIRENKYPAKTVITDLLLSNKSVEIGDKINGRVILQKNISKSREIELKYGNTNFSFEFAALHYAAPSKNEYAYMLEGFDTDWTQTTAKKRYATYTNLKPGNYIFKVKASNNDGVWNPEPTILHIRIIPPWYLTHIAYVCYGLVLIGLLWLFWRYTFIRTSEKHQLELESVERERSEELQRMKLEFFTNISHEFRTPLTLIKGPLEYVQKNVSTLDQKSLKVQFGLMQKNTNYLLRLVTQLLDFRKITQGKMRLVMRNSDIIAFIREVAEPFQFMAHKQSIDFEVDAISDTLITWFDHEALEKIMNNLLSNAFKFTEAGGRIRVKISEDIIEGKNEVVIKVKDSGIGMPKAKMSKIFERFNSAKEGTNNQKINPEGIGIGLSFTKNLVELHQGRIEIFSKPDKGTKFVVHLPKDKETYTNINEISCKDVSDNDFLVRSSETESFAIGLNDDLIDEGLSETRSKLPVLLVVDDNPDIRTFISKVLGKTYTVYQAENGKKGLEIAKKVMPNIVICDIVMPIMDGIDFSRHLKSQPETSHIPIIILTAKSSQEIELKSLELGVDEYLRKPFDFELLKLKLSNIIKRREQLRKRFNRKITVQPSEIAVTSMDEKFLSQAIEIVEKHMMNTDFNVEMLVKEMGLSRSTLYLKFKELTGLSSSEFIRNVRLKRAVQFFNQSSYSVKEIMYKTGFSTASYFSKCFKKQFGVVPSEYVKQISKKKEAADT